MRYVLRRWIGSWIRRSFFSHATSPSLYWLIHSNWISRCVYLAAEFNLAEKLKSTPQSIEQLASECGLDARALTKVMRLLGACDVFRLGSDGTWGLGRQGSLLLDDSSIPMKYWALTMGRECWQSADPFVEAVRQNVSGFKLHHGMTLWEYYDQHKEAHQVFVRAQSDFTVWHAPRLARSFNFGRFPKIVDIGGGRGCLAMGIAKHFPNVDVTVIDREDTARLASPVIRASGLAERCRVLGGNFLESVPKDADLYIIKHVLRDWPDQGAEQILQTVRRAITGRGVLMIIDGIASESGREDPLVSLMDVQLFGDMGGGLRDLQHWRALLKSGGFSLRRVLATEIPDASLMLAE